MIVNDLYKTRWWNRFHWEIIKWNSTQNWVVRFKSKNDIYKKI